MKLLSLLRSSAVAVVGRRAPPHVGGAAIGRGAETEDTAVVRIGQYKQCKRQYSTVVCVAAYRRCIGIQVVCSEIVLTARGLLRGVPEVPVRAGRHHVVKDEPLVVVRRQGRLPEGH